MLEEPGPYLRQSVESWTRPEIRIIIRSTYIIFEALDNKLSQVDQTADCRHQALHEDWIVLVLIRNIFNIVIMDHQLLYVFCADRFTVHSVGEAFSGMVAQIDRPVEIGLYQYL